MNNSSHFALPPRLPAPSANTAGSDCGSIGCVTAILLLANAVRDYVFVSRLLATQQVRHQMTQVAAQIEQLLRRSAPTSDTLQSALGGSFGAASINLRDQEGTFAPASLYSLKA